MLPLVSRPVIPRPVASKRSGHGTLPPLPRSLLQLIIKRSNEVEPVVTTVSDATTA